MDIKNSIGGIYVEDKHDSDNLSIVLCSYFSGHVDQPEDDPTDEDNGSWGEWVIQKEEEAIERIALGIESILSDHIRNKLNAFSENEALTYLGMIKVGNDNSDPPQEIVKRLAGAIILDLFGIDYQVSK